MVYHLGIRIQSVGRVLSTSVRSETILIPELQFTTLNTNLVLTCLESSKLIDFLKKTRWLDQVSDLTPIFKVRSQIPLFLFHPQNCPSLLLASAIVVTESWKTMIWCRCSPFIIIFKSLLLLVTFPTVMLIFCKRWHLRGAWLFLHRHLRLYFMMMNLKAWEQDSSLVGEEDSNLGKEWVLGIWFFHINNIYDNILYYYMALWIRCMSWGWNFKNTYGR